MRYKYVIAGGTLDYLHKGHRALLDRAFSAGERIYIGITTDEFAKQKVVSRQPSAVRQKISAINNQQLTTSNYHKREREGRAYLKEKGWIDRVEMVPISDRFGTTLVDEKLEAIVVSPETELVATEINLLRAQKNWPALEIIVVPWVLAEDEKPINSVRIRNGEIDREGRLFALPKEWGVRKLPEELRKKLKKPLGRLVQSSSISHQAIRNSPFPLFPKERVPPLWERGGKEGFLLITVGDVVTESLLKTQVVPNISIVDLKIHRRQVYEKVTDLGFRNIKVLKKAKNMAGTLSYESYASLLSLMRSEAAAAVLQIEGEEDLLTLLAIFIAPLGSVVIYGQPDQGIVIVEVTEEKKKEVRNYINQFTS